MSRLSPIGQSSHLEPAKAADSHASSSTWNKSGNPLATRVSSILSTSYSDADFRGTLTVIDGRGIKNDGNARRRLRLHLQREVIEKNGKVLDEFGLVSEVIIFSMENHGHFTDQGSNSNTSKSRSTS